ncbi:G5 domain-containing protein [Anaerococcus ihuae]|uniref:G5 domain-containing protein n=1 Tax=Anaerococcus ihuae TaxID=2899519 RepID=UPI001F45E648|nr:G5 domain-containing protein [Anaerococcus ihuae]
MNKKKDIIALALSVSFVIGGASLSHADEINPDTTSYISEKQPTENENKSSNQIEDKENEDVTEVVNNSNTDEIQNLELSEEKTPESQKAPQEVTDPNYAEDEKNVGNYKETQLERGNGPAATYTPPTEMDRFIDGFRYKTLEPSAASPDKTLWGFEIEFDRDQGQRTYTDFSFTNTGNLGTVLNTGTISSKDLGEKIDDSFKEVNYKSKSEIDITASGRALRNLNLYADKKDFEHINNVDNKNTVMAWEGHYKKGNPNGLKATEGGSAAFNFTVNPWPNENDQLDLIYLNGDYDKKEFVKGQTINTGIKVENLDDNARERLVGQVYHPVSGDVVPGAEAYIDENDMVVVKMPEGALKKDDNGKTVINEDSIFSKAGYKNIQSLDVKFFARPRTEEEFRKIAVAAQYEGLDYYTPTGAGTETINHKGNNVTIDKQGIARYDHYNKVGEFKINLDDTMYYDQRFEDGNDDDTTKVTSSAVKPEEPFEVKIVPPANPGETDKSAADMNGAESRGEAAGELILDFIEKENKGKAEKDKWKVDIKDNDISKFTITPPASAKAGDFVAVAIKYTYTNGSTDTHWFHFVVQESTYIKPEYETQVNYPTRQQTSPATVKDDHKRIKPDHYTLPDNLETDGEGNKLIKDDIGHEWTVSIDGKTGEVTAKPVKPEDFVGGEKLTVPVIAHYVDKQKPGEDITENVDAYFVIKEKANMTARYNAKAGKSGDELSSDVILNTEDTYNRRPTKFTLDSDTFTDDKGNTWNVTIDEKTGKVTATVPNAQEGQSIDGALLNVPVTAHYFEMEDGKEVSMGTRQTEVQFVASGTEEKVEKILDVPFETKVEKDPELKKGEIKVVQEGEVGSKKVTYTIKDSKITDTQEEELKEAKPRIIHVGEGTEDGNHEIKETVEVPFEVEIQFDDTLKPGEQKVTQEGIPGEKTRTTTITIQDGNVTNTQVGEFTETKAPQKKIIKVGANTEGKVEHKEEIPFGYKVEFDPKFHENYPDATDNYKVVTEGVAGEKTTTWTIKNSQIVEGPDQTVTKKPVDAVIKVGQKNYTGTITHTEKIETPFKVEYRYNPDLEAGQTKKVQEGKDGSYTLNFSQNIKNGQADGAPTTSKTDEVAAQNEIIEIGTKPVTKVVEKPFNTEYIFDENLEAGKTEEATPGKNGKVTITTTYDKDQKKVVTSEKEEGGQNRVVKIGGKTNGTEKVKEEIPFEVEVRKDPSLKKGEWKYAKDDEGNELKGEKGEQERTLTIENSKVTKTSEPTVTKKAKNAVILVGEGTNDGTHKIVEKKELPFETRYEYDDSLEPGEEKIVTPGSPGKQERTNTLVIKDGKVVETKEGEFKTTKEPQERLIKIGRKPSEGETTETHRNKIPFDTKVIYDENLEAGSQIIEKEGRVGEEEVTTTQKIKDSKPIGDPEISKKTITEKEDRIVRIGVKPVVKETELGNNTEYRHNPELKAGEEKVIEEGSKGSVKYTTTFNKETGKLEVKEERTEPTNKVVEYGSKTDGEFTYESEKAYDIIIRENPDLEAGKTNVIQEGKPGKTETTVKIENSKEVSRDTKTITEKQDKIIEIGTKNVCEIPPVNPGEEDPKDPEKPGEENPKDPEKPGEEDPKDPNKPGEEDPEDPEKPGEKDPEDPNKPGKEDPKDPSNPGEEDPKNPEKPGEEKPNEPGTPGEPGKPNKPGKPGEDDPKDPETPGEEKPNDSGKPDEKDPTKPGQTSETPQKPKDKKDKKINPSRKLEKTKIVSNKENANKNPSTGVSSLSTVLSSLGLSLGALGFSKKKRKNK